MIKAVLFDLDGVIVKTDLCHYEAWKQIADREGIYFDLKINHRLRGVSRMKSLEIILEKAKHTYTEEEKNRLAAEKNEYYRNLIKNLTPNMVIEGTKELIDDLKKQGIKIAVGSSSKNAREILKGIGLESIFDAVVQGTDIINSKPDPEVFLKAAELLQVNANQCVVIEDSKAGIEAAGRGNMKSIYLGRGEENVKANLIRGLLKDITAEIIIRL